MANGVDREKRERSWHLAASVWSPRQIDETSGVGGETASRYYARSGGRPRSAHRVALRVTDQATNRARAVLREHWRDAPALQCLTFSLPTPVVYRAGAGYFHC